MSSQSGSVYGLTLLCPIIDDDNAIPSHDLQIRHHLSKLSLGPDGPFAIAPGTHLARLVVLDDVIYVGMPSCEEHLHSKYLVLECNCDGDRDSYLTGLLKHIPEQIDAIWQHCTGYPGTKDLAAFLAYMRKCEIETTFFFAPVNDKSVTQTLSALQTQRAVAAFIATHQSCSAADLRQDFMVFIGRLAKAPPPLPAALSFRRELKTGGRNE
jgi:hypothetical protein